MVDKIIMDTSLTLVKNTCELLLHGSIESSTKNVEATFQTSLDKYLTMQGDIYKSMEDGGLYTTSEVPASKIEKVCNARNESI